MSTRKAKRGKKLSLTGKVSADVKRNALLLKILARAKNATRKEILQTGDASLTKAICECAKNVLSGRVPSSARQVSKMRRHMKILRTITEKKVPLSRRRDLMKQKGGFLPALMAPLLPILARLVGTLF